MEFMHRVVQIFGDKRTPTSQETQASIPQQHQVHCERINQVYANPWVCYGLSLLWPALSQYSKVFRAIKRKEACWISPSGCGQFQEIYTQLLCLTFSCTSLVTAQVSVAHCWESQLRFSGEGVDAWVYLVVLVQTSAYQLTLSDVSIGPTLTIAVDTGHLGLVRLIII